MVASPQVASAPPNVLHFCFELNFHLPAEFDIKHTLICRHAHNYWLTFALFRTLLHPRTAEPPQRTAGGSYDQTYDAEVYD